MTQIKDNEELIEQITKDIDNLKIAEVRTLRNIEHERARLSEKKKRKDELILQRHTLYRDSGSRAWDTNKNLIRVGDTVEIVNKFTKFISWPAVRALRNSRARSARDIHNYDRDKFGVVSTSKNRV